jgi:hypothetical protein
MLVMANLTVHDNLTDRITMSFPRLMCFLSGRGMNIARLSQWC